ncbi:MAG TPA: phosphosulfolactate synthase [Jatrophihabitantaceae bacterium]|jgi:phosphosulfolactate synthase
MTGRPDFLVTPPRSSKPRRAGLTHVLDKATPIPVLEAYLGQHGEVIDFVKLGWGLGYLDAHVADRVEMCRRYGAVLVTGGTFLEIAAQQRRVEEFHDWALSQRIPAVEVSNGLSLLSRDEKQKLVARLSADFVVLAETGSKDDNTIAEPLEWAQEMAGDLAAGASWAIAEGRESGRVGLYHHDGSIRDSLVDILASRVDPSAIVFEAPRKSQQLWLIKHLGPDVGLGNIELADVGSVESLRVGLRADTALDYLRAGTA